MLGRFLERPTCRQVGEGRRRYRTGKHSPRVKDCPGLGDPNTLKSSCHHVIIPYHKKNGVRLKSFLVPNQFQNYKPPLLPFSKEVSPKIRAVGAITFYDASANADQKFIAPPKRNFLENKVVDSEHVLQILLQQFFCGAEK